MNELSIGMMCLAICVGALVAIMFVDPELESKRRKSYQATFTLQLIILGATGYAGSLMSIVLYFWGRGEDAPTIQVVWRDILAGLPAVAILVFFNLFVLASSMLLLGRRFASDLALVGLKVPPDGFLGPNTIRWLGAGLGLLLVGLAAICLM